MGSSGATNVYDVNSKGLTEIALRFNQGMPTDGDALKTQTNFNIAGHLIDVRKLDGAVRRLEKIREWYPLHNQQSIAREN